MKLHVLRHAKTNLGSESNEDFDRKLASKGKKQVINLCSKLPDLRDVTIHCSSAVRAKETLGLILNERVAQETIFTRDLYLCSHLEILYYLNQLEGNSELMLVGHNSGLSDFVSYISDNFIQLKTCSYVCLEIEVDSWNLLSRGTARVIMAYRPEVE